MRLTQILLRNRWELVPGVVSPTTEKYSNLPKRYIRRAMRQVRKSIPQFNNYYKCEPKREYLFNSRRLDRMANTKRESPLSAENAWA